MADEETLTSPPEPDANLTSSTVEPEPSPDADQSASHQPTLEEVVAERDRYKAAAKGSAKLSEELQAERTRRQQMEWQMQQFQQAQQQQQQYQYPAPQPQINEEEIDLRLADDLNNAMLAGDKAAGARVIRQINDRARIQAETGMKNMLGQAVTYSNQQQNFAGYLQNIGMQRGTPLFNRAMAIQKELNADPNVMSFTAGNQAWIASIAAERARSEAVSGKTAAMETIKMQTGETASSEGGSRGNGAPPGKSPTSKERIYLTDEERRKAEKFFPGSAEKAHEQYWKNLDPWKREQRTQAGKAIV